MNIDYIVLFISCCIIGSVMGSFLNLAMYRIPLKQDIIYKHSYCPKCEHKLQFLDLIPILSFLFLRGKCRHCKMPIKPRYLYVELLMLTIYAITFVIYGLTVKTLMFLSFYTILVLIIGMLIEKEYISKGTIITLILINFLYFVYKTVYNYDIIEMDLFLFVAILLISIYFVIRFDKNKVTLVYTVLAFTILNICSLPYSFIILIVSYVLAELIRMVNTVKLNKLVLFNLITLFFSLVYNLAQGFRWVI